jgi:hypothetical protein
MSFAAYHRRISLIREMFLDTADQNYIGARAAFFERRDHDFWWLTLHAVEKYLKAALLMNGASASKPTHNIQTLLGRLKKIDPRLEPPPFVRPKFAGAAGWLEVINDDFVQKLNVYGSPANRYAMFSYVIADIDIFRADHLVYWARRHALVFKTDTSGEQIDWIAELEANPRLWRHLSGAPLEKLLDLPPSDVRRQTFRRWNVAFFPDIRPGRRQKRGALAHNAGISRSIRVLRGSTPGSQERSEHREVLQWVIDNVYLPKEEVAELNAILGAHP